MEEKELLTMAPDSLYNVTCSHHLTSFEVGASYSMPQMGQVSISYPRLPGGSILSPVTGIKTMLCPDMGTIRSGYRQILCKE
ncbi:MAG: hypothetical protein MSA72_10055, partial [Lachnospiraceae bacterium]|nr:hypothetical protein [Lachnospiraceae bacterium]